MVEVGRLLDQPPGVFLAAAVVVVAVADPVEVGGVEGVAPHVFERPVGAAVLRDLGVPVELAPEELIGLAAGPDPVVAHPGDVGRLVGVDRGRDGRRLGSRRTGSAARAGEVERGDLEVVVDHPLGRPGVGVVPAAEFGGRLDLAAEPAVGAVEGQDRAVRGSAPGPGGCRAGCRSGGGAAGSTRPSPSRAVAYPTQTPPTTITVLLPQMASWRWRNASQGRPSRSTASRG